MVSGERSGVFNGSFNPEIEKGRQQHNTRIKSLASQKAGSRGPVLVRKNWDSLKIVVCRRNGRLLSRR